MISDLNRAGRAEETPSKLPRDAERRNVRSTNRSRSVQTERWPLSSNDDKLAAHGAGDAATAASAKALARHISADAAATAVAASVGGICQSAVAAATVVAGSRPAPQIPGCPETPPAAKGSCWTWVNLVGCCVADTSAQPPKRSPDLELTPSGRGLGSRGPSKAGLRSSRAC